MKFLNKIISILKSRTVITLLIMFAYNVVDITGAHISPDLNLLINTLLTALAGYFRISTKQDYSKEIE